MRALWRYERGDLAEYRFEAADKVRSAQLARDGVGRVVEAIVDGTAQRFAYDAAGELLSAETPAGAFSFTYDANGRLVCETGAAGRLEYEYDAAGQLLARRGRGETTAFEYDGAGRRTLAGGHRTAPHVAVGRPRPARRRRHRAGGRAGFSFHERHRRRARRARADRRDRVHVGHAPTGSHRWLGWASRRSSAADRHGRSSAATPREWLTPRLAGHDRRRRARSLGRRARAGRRRPGAQPRLPRRDRVRRRDVAAPSRLRAGHTVVPAA